MRQFTKIEKEAPTDFENFRIHMQREMILRKLRKAATASQSSVLR